MYKAFSHSVNFFAGHEPRPNIYRTPGNPTTGYVMVTMPFSGIITRDGKDITTDKFKIAYTIWGNKGPLVAILHGVPTNKKQWYPVQKRMASFCRTISFDMLGMGESDHPREYGKDSKLPSGWKPWLWQYDALWVEQVMQTLYPNEKFGFVADDWGGGINLHYAVQYPNRLTWIGFLDPIAFDGYPVNEIQAIGRGSMIRNPEEFMKAFGVADQTMVQIFKTMVYDPNKYNQYNLRDIIGTYVRVDYDTLDSDSLTMGLDLNALRVLADRSAILAPKLLLPYDLELNPFGVDYSKITIPVIVLWGEFDNMMPANQIYRFANAIHNAPVHIGLIPRAGHFAATDQPDKVAEELLNFMREHMGITALADIFLGFTGIWKGDEELLIRDLRRIYGKESPPESISVIDSVIPIIRPIKEAKVIIK